MMELKEKQDVYQTELKIALELIWKSSIQLSSFIKYFIGTGFCNSWARRPFQLAPNPASSMLSVTYNVESENSDISIKLYNMMGKLVAEYSPQNQTEGKYNYEINLNSITNVDELQNGVYLCALSINGELQTKKFMLIK